MDLYDGACYAKHSACQKKSALTFLSDLEIARGASYLDVGCGDGKITHEIATKHELSAIGIDVSESMIAYANTHYACDKILFQKICAQDFIKKEYFDLITCFSMLHWLENPKKALQNIYDSLNRGGKFYLLTAPKESEFLQVFLRTLEKERWRNLQRRPSCTRKYADEYLQLLKETGFILKQSSLKTISAVMNSTEDFKNHIRGFVRGYAFFEEREVEEFVEDATQEALSIYARDENNGLIVAGKALYVICCKR